MESLYTNALIESGKAMTQTRLIKALADDTRLRIMSILIVVKVPVCVCEIVDALDLPQYLISRHLIILKNAELVSVVRKGTWAYYSVNRKNGSYTALLVFLKAFLSDEMFDKDRKQMARRILLRKDGKCVVGFPTKEEQSTGRFERRRMQAKERA